MGAEELPDTDLDEVIAEYAAIVPDLDGRGNPDLPERLAHAAYCHFVRADRTHPVDPRHAEDLARAAELLRRAEPRWPGGRPERYAEVLHGIVVARRTRLETPPRGLDDEVDRVWTGLSDALTERGSAFREDFDAVDALSVLFRHRAARTGAPSDLDGWARWQGEVVALARADGGPRAYHLAVLGDALLQLAGVRGDAGRRLADLAASAAASDEAQALFDPDDQEARVEVLANACRARTARAGALGDAEELRRVVADAEKALALGTSDRHTRRDLDLLLGAALSDLLSRDRPASPAAEAAATARAARSLGAVLTDLEELPDHDGLKQEVVFRTGVALGGHARSTGDPGALGRALELLERAVVATADGGPDHPGRVSAYALLVVEGAQLGLGDATRCARALNLLERAERRYHGPADREALSGAVALVRPWLAAVRGDGDLDAAVAVLRSAPSRVGADVRDRLPHLVALSAALLARYGRAGMVGDLDAAVRVLDEVLDEVPADSGGYPVLLAQLGSAVAARALRTGRQDRLPDVLARVRDLRDRLGGHPLHERVMAVEAALGVAAAEERVAEERVAEERVAEDRGPERPPEWSGPPAPARLGEVTAARGVARRDRGLFAAGVEAMRDLARRTPSGSPDAPAAYGSLGAAMSAWHEVFGVRAHLAETIDWLERALAEPDGRPSPEVRVKLALAYRAAVDSIPAYRELSRATGLAALTGSGSADLAWVVAHWCLRDGAPVEAVAALEVGCGLALAGVDEPGAPPAVEDVAAALRTAGHDALCYFVPGVEGEPGHVLLVRASGEVASAPVPGLRADAPEVARYRREYRAEPATQEAAALTGVCDWAWAAVAPLLASASRIVLVAAGGLGELPWHAASRPEGGARRYAVQDALFCRTPSARVFCRTASREWDRRPGAGLVVGGPLPYARLTAEAVRDRFYPRGAAGPEVLPALPGGEDPQPTVVLAGHFRPVPGEPSRSALGEAVTVGRVLDQARRAVGDRGPFVDLTACTAAVGGGEPLTLDAVLAVAGAVGVVGARWEVPDLFASALRYLVHHYLVDEGLPPAEAVRAAQLAFLAPDFTPPPAMPPELAEGVRRAGGDPHHWAGFAYTGR
ncbi:CHAT domain-containing protein [Saccharothrix xinjiangensis]|uniref:CHAT domain-containing protein n=1 Tax=Saccharothrix xinjiangensis TaxID=204798 RepID=A0ABV9YA32_9PSEU